MAARQRFDASERQYWHASWGRKAQSAEKDRLQRIRPSMQYEYVPEAYADTQLTESGTNCGDSGLHSDCRLAYCVHCATSDQTFTRTYKR